MPPDVDEVHRKSIDAVTGSLERDYPPVSRLGARELRQIGLDREVAGWRLIRCGLVLVVGVDRHFPYSVPRVAIVDRPELVGSPHWETDHRLCLVGDGARVDSRRPEEIIRHLLNEAVALETATVRGETVGDFRTDFDAYWQRAATSTFKVLVRLDPAGPSRAVCAWHGLKFYLVGESHAQTLGWMSNAYGDSDRTTQPAYLVWVDVLPEPGAYPNSVADLRTMLAAQGGEALASFDIFLQSTPAQACVVLGGPRPAGQAALSPP